MADKPHIFNRNKPYTTTLPGIKHKILINKFLNIFSRYGLIFGGAFIILISSIILTNGYLKNKIVERNETVIVKVIDCYEYKRNYYFLKFEYKNKNFTKRTKYSYCKKYSSVDNVKMLTNENNDKFIFPDENIKNNNYFFGLILSFMGIIIIIKGLKT